MHHGAQFRRDDRHHVEDHPLGLVAARAEGLHDLKALDDALALLALAVAAGLALGDLLQFIAQFPGQRVQVDVAEHFAHRLGADADAELPAVLHRLLLFHLMLALGKQLVLFEIREGAGIEYDIAGEVQDLFQRPGADIEQRAHAAGDALEVPDVAHGRGQFDVAHALAAHLGLGHFHAALVAHHALEAGALVFSAVALPVLGGAEDALAEEAVALGLERAVVDGLGLGHLAVRPLADLLRGGQSDLNGVKIR